MLVLAPAGAADACQCIDVTVLGADGGVVYTRSVSAAEVATWADQPPTSYDDPSGRTIEVPQALPVRSLIEQLAPEDGGLAVDGVSFVEIASANGSSVLDRARRQLADDGNPYAVGHLPAFYPAGGGMAYIRQSTGAEYPQDQALLQSPDGRPLTMTVHTSGALLATTISADPTTVAVGEPVTFLADVQATAASLTYTWHFGGVDVATPANRATYSWATPGLYKVALDVHGADSSAGRSNALVVSVTGPSPSTAPSPTPTPTGPAVPGATGGTHNPTTGPRDGGGSRPSGSPDPNASPTSRPGGEGSHGPESGSAGGGEQPTIAPSVSPAPTPSATPSPQQAGPGAVTGVLLAGAAVPAGAAPGEPDTAAAIRAARDDHPLRLPGWAGVALALAATVAAGALGESGWFARHRPRRSARMQP